MLKADKKSSIRAAYLYYYASEAAFPPGSNSSSTANPKAKTEEKGKPEDEASQTRLSARLNELVHDLLILAKREGFHVFNALTLLDNPLFLREQRFEPGDGRLNFYLFNWRTAALPGGVDASNMIDTSKMGGVGVVML